MKCILCTKRLTKVQTTLPCKCGLFFCADHRLPECHDCIMIDRFRQKLVLPEALYVKMQKL